MIEKCNVCGEKLVQLGIKQFCSNCQFIDLEPDGISYNNW